MAVDSEPLRVENARSRQRYEVRTAGDCAFLEYHDSPGGALVLDHTEVPPAFEGRGVGGLLVKTALEDARAQGRRVVPACPFVFSYIKRHPEYEPLVHPDSR